MAGTERTRLRGHPPIPSTERGGLGLVLVSLPLLAIGAFVVWLWLGREVPETEGASGPPGWIFAMIGVVFGFAGLSVTGSGLAGMARARAARRRKKEHPREPWHWDHSWDSSRAEHGSLGAAVQGIGGFVLTQAFLAPFHWMAFFSGKDNLPVLIVTLIVDLVSLSALWKALYQLLQHLKYGTSRFHFSRFPFRPGETVEGGLEVSRKIAAGSGLSLTLRYIEEIIETTGSGRSRRSEPVLYRLQEVRQEISPAQFDAGSALDIPISVRLPPGDLSNRLLDTPRRYWELEVKAETPGIDYVARFLLPVYSLA